MSVLGRWWVVSRRGRGYCHGGVTGSEGRGGGGGRLGGVALLRLHFTCVTTRYTYINIQSNDNKSLKMNKMKCIALRDALRVLRCVCCVACAALRVLRSVCVVLVNISNKDAS